MVITTWNIRHGGGKRTKEIISVLKENINSDVFILTEFRNNTNKEIIENAFRLFGFNNIYLTKADSKTNSVLIACKDEYNVKMFEELKEHKQRVIKISSNTLSIYGCYFPQQKLKKKVFEFLISEIEKNQSENTIIIGDFNTGKHFLDEKGSSFYCSEYLFELENNGMIDAWRYINGDLKEYSWFSNAGNGFRIDHIFIKDSLKNNIVNCYYKHSYRENNYSDHSLMTVELKIKP